MSAHSSLVFIVDFCSFGFTCFCFILAGILLEEVGMRSPLSDSFLHGGILLVLEFCVIIWPAFINTHEMCVQDVWREGELRNISDIFLLIMLSPLHALFCKYY